MQPDALFDSASTELVHSLFRFLEIARDRRTTIVQSVCVALILGAIYFALAPRYYDSNAKLLIVRRNSDQVADVADQPALDSTMATHRELVLSPVVIQQAIEHLLPEHRIDLENAAPSEWARILARNLSARTVRKANFIEVSYRSRSPEAAAAVVSAVIQSYLQFVDHTHKGSASEAIFVLSQKSGQVAASLAAKKDELHTCRDRIGSLAVEPNSGIVEPTIQRVLKLNEALMNAQQKRLKLEASHDAIQAAMQNGEDLQQHLIGLEEVVGRQMMISALGLTPQDLSLVKAQEQKLIEARAELQRTAPYYGPSHPKVVALNEQVRSLELYLTNYRAHTTERFASFGGGDFGPLLERMLRQSVAQARQEENRLQIAFDAERDRARAQTDDVQRMQDVEREVARLEAEYDSLISKVATVDIHQLQAPIQATVVQEPLPDEIADSPKLRLVGLLSLMGGLLMGGVVAYVQDVLDDRFSSPEQMAAQLSVPVLSMVRRMNPLDGTGLATVHTFVSPNAVETEAFRTLRTALTLGTAPAERIAVSSAEPSDGKTTVAANLAVSFAQAGKRTLVIDADLRKPGMTALMGLKGQPGVADLVYGRDEPAAIVAEFVHSTDQPGLDVLPAGLRRPNAAELLGDQRFVELLAWAEATYDQVLVDCPPVLAVSDAQIVGRLVDGALLVVQPQKNHRRLVARACHSFTATGTTVLGVVANGLSQEFGRGYGYGYGYEYGYGYGHDTAGEAPAVDSSPPETVPWRKAA